MILLISILFFFHASMCFADEIEFEWNAADGADGYRIYYGQQSRFDSSLDKAAIYGDLIKKYCGENADCIESWDNYCERIGEPDNFCDNDFFKYGNSIDVGNVTTSIVEDLEKKLYHFSVVSYENDGEPTIISTGRRESKYSDELPVDLSPARPTGTGMVSPLEDYEILENSQEFCWQTDDDTINRWAIWLGTGIEGKSREDIYRSGFAKELRCKTIGNLPLNGDPIYLIFWWRIEDVWYMGDRIRYRTIDKTAPAMPSEFMITAD